MTRKNFNIFKKWLISTLQIISENECFNSIHHRVEWAARTLEKL